MKFWIPCLKGAWSLDLGRVLLGFGAGIACYVVTFIIIKVNYSHLLMNISYSLVEYDIYAAMPKTGACLCCRSNTQKSQGRPYICLSGNSNRYHYRQWTKKFLSELVVCVLSMPQIAIGCGGTVAYLIGSFVNWRVLALLGSFLFILFCTFTPHTHTHMLHVHILIYM